MDVDIFLNDPNPRLGATLEEVLRGYPELFRVRWHPRSEPELYQQLYLASYPLDLCSGHPLEADEPCEATGYLIGYGEPELAMPPAVALFNRLALLDAPGGVKELRAGVWTAAFTEPETLRAGFYRAFQDALRALTAADQALLSRCPDLSDTDAAHQLEVTIAALRRAREAIWEPIRAGKEQDGQDG